MLKKLALVLALGTVGCGTPIGVEPINLEISYYDRSDSGSRDGTGMVFIDPLTGQVDTTVMNLPMLTNDVYEGWLAGGGEAPTSTGRFNTDANGDGMVSVTLGDIQERTYSFFILTIEPEPDDDPDPDPRHSIGADLP